MGTVRGEKSESCQVKDGDRGWAVSEIPSWMAGGPVQVGAVAMCQDVTCFKVMHQQKGVMGVWRLVCPRWHGDTAPRQDDSSLGSFSSSEPL